MENILKTMAENLLFERYRIIDKLGGGGFSEVFKAFDTRMEREVAIKKISAHPKGATRAVREAKTVASLNHPNIVTLYDFVESETGYFLIMEYLKGLTLSEIISRKARFTEEECLAVGLEVCLALEYAHAHEVIHRDIKPQNLILGSDGRIKVTDFGIARLKSSELTREGEILGTLAYMAPEQAEGKYVDEAADIFSLGAILYQLLTGEAPFRAETPGATMFKILRHFPEPPRVINPKISADWDRLILKALEKDPDDRWQSATELRYKLERIAPAKFSAKKTLKQLISEVSGDEPSRSEEGFKEMVFRWGKGRNESLKNLVGSLFVSLNFFFLVPGFRFYPQEIFYLFAGLLFLLGLFRLSWAILLAIPLMALPLFVSSFLSGLFLLFAALLYWLLFSRKYPFYSLLPWAAPYLSLVNLGLLFPLFIGLIFSPLTAALLAVLGGLSVELYGILSNRPLLEVFSVTSWLGRAKEGFSPVLLIKPFLDHPFLALQILLWGMGAFIVSLLARKRRLGAYVGGILLGSLFLAIGYTSLPMPLGLESPSVERVMQALSFSLIILLGLLLFFPYNRPAKKSD